MVNRELAKLCIRFAVNQLSLNLSKITKTNYMLFRSRPPDVNINLCINNERITRVCVKTYLGVFIDDNLNWKHHINMP